MRSLGDWRPSALLMLLALCATAALAPGQRGTVKFNPEKHLEGWEQAFWGEFNDLYDLKPFRELEDQPVAPARLEELRRLWAEERERVAGRIAEIQRDPKARFFYSMERRLRKHRFFKEVDFRCIGEHDPFIFVIERPRKTNPAYEGKVISAYLPWLRELEAVFKEILGGGSELPRNPEMQCYPIAFLASEGSYRDFAKAIENPGLVLSAAHYDSELRLAVTYEEPFATYNVKPEKLHSVLHEFVHILQHAYSGTAGEMPKPIWFVEGVAECLAGARPAKPEELRRLAVNPDHVKLLLALAKDDRTWKFAMSSLVDLVCVDGPGYQGVLARAAGRGGRRMDQKLSMVALTAFYAQSALFVNFLLQGEKQRYRPAFLRYARAATGGKSGQGVFMEAFADHDLKQIEEHFLGFIGDQARKLHDEYFPIRLRLPATVGPRPDLPAEVAAPQAPPRPALGPLDLGKDEWRERLAAAVHLAAEGWLEQAHALLAEEQIAGCEDQAKSRLTRERERLGALLELRQELLESKLNRQLFVRSGEEQHRGKLVKLEHGRLHIQVGRDELRQIPVRMFGPENILREGRSLLKEKQPWMGGYLVLLMSGLPERAWTRLAGGDARTVTLRDDLDGYSDLRASGKSAALLALLLSGELPEDPAGAGERLGFLRDLVREHAKAPLIQQRLEGFKDLARYLAYRTFDPAQAECLGIHGAMAGGAKGRLVITYDFKSQAQLEDFTPSPDYMRAIREGLPPVTVPQQPAFTIKDGALVGIGDTCIRHVLPLASPLTIKYRASFAGDGEFLFGVCDDGFEHNIMCSTVGDISVIDTKEKVLGAAMSRERSILIGKSYAFELVHDGADVFESRIDGQPRARATRLGSLRTGAIFIWVHTNEPMIITELVIEAGLDEAGLGEVRARWVQKCLAEIFRP